MQTIERELPWVQPLPSVKDHLFLGGLKRLFPASVLTGIQAIGSGQGGCNRILCESTASWLRPQPG